MFNQPEVRRKIMVVKTKEKAASKPAKPKAAKKPAAAKATPAEAPATTEAAAPVSTAKFAIRDDVPCPERSRVGGGVAIYPLGQLVKAGQSFVVTADVDKDLFTSDAEYQQGLKEEKRAIQNRLSGAARRYMKSHPDVKLAVRVLADGSVGVWRVDAA